MHAELAYPAHSRSTGLDAARSGRDATVSGFDKHRQMAYSLIGTRKVRDALDVAREPIGLRESYGMTVFGQGCLAARRLDHHVSPSGSLERSRRYGKRLVRGAPSAECRKTSVGSGKRFFAATLSRLQPREVLEGRNRQASGLPLGPVATTQRLKKTDTIPQS